MAVIQGIGPDGKTPINVAVDAGGGVIPGASLTADANAPMLLTESTGRRILSELRQIRILLAQSQGIAAIYDPMDVVAPDPDLISN